MEVFSPESIGQYLDYLKDVRVLSAHSVKAYGSDLQDVRRWFDAQQNRISEMDIRHIRAYVAQLGRNGYSQRSVNRRLSALRGYFTFIQRRENDLSSIPADQVGVEDGSNHPSVGNPAASVKSLKLPQHLPRFLFEAQMEGLLSELKQASEQGFAPARNYLLFELMYSTGCRVSEAAGIRLEDINMGRSRILVRGKGGAERFVFLHQNALLALKTYLPFRRELLEKNGGPKGEGAKAPASPDSSSTTQALFLNSRGQAISVRGIHYLLDRAGRRMGLDQGLHPHMLRHSFATHLMNNGADIRHVQEMLGHKNLSTTQVYTHTSLGQLREVYRRAHPHSRRKS